MLVVQLRMKTDRFAPRFGVFLSPQGCGSKIRWDLWGRLCVGVISGFSEHSSCAGASACRVWCPLPVAVLTEGAPCVFQWQRQRLLPAHRRGRRGGRHGFSTPGLQWAHPQVWLQHPGAGGKVLVPGAGGQAVALRAHVSTGLAWGQLWARATSCLLPSLLPFTWVYQIMGPRVLGVLCSEASDSINK